MLRSRLFANNQRLNAAAINGPMMRRGETDKGAVRLLQQALRDLNVAAMRRSIRSDGMFDGDFGGETFRGLQKFQLESSIAGDTGVGSGCADQQTLELMDDRLATLGVVPLTPATAASAAPPTETSGTLGTPIPKLPSAQRLYREYRKFTAVAGKPCGRSIRNQCAIRLTIALARCDIGFYLASHSRGDLFIHSANSRLCGGGLEAHDASAGRVFRYISRFWNFTFLRYGRDMSSDDAYRRISGSPAIIFFDRLKQTSPDSTASNHIDFFDGKRIMNDQLNYAAPGEPRPGEAEATFRDTRRGIHVLRLPR